MRAHAISVVGLLYLVGLLPIDRSALAQRPATPRDSLPKDSQPARPVGVGCEMCGLVALAAVAAVMVAAPSAVLLIKEKRDADTTGHLRVWPARNHITVSFVGGGSWETPGKGWVHAENLEVVKGHLHGELRVEDLHFSDLGSVQFQTIRAGYFLHRRALLRGGATVGYRNARGDRVQNAVEVGLPLEMGSERGWMRFEPTYVLSSAGVTWNYRLQGDFPIAHTPLLIGFNVEAKTLRQGGAYFGTAALVLGFRF
jgi:hypothetical protein